jgi:hypothetical protein
LYLSSQRQACLFCIGVIAYCGSDKKLNDSFGIAMDSKTCLNQSRKMCQQVVTFLQAMHPIGRNALFRTDKSQSGPGSFVCR